MVPHDSDQPPARADIESDPEASLWAALDGAGVRWLLLAESARNLPHVRGYQIYVDGHARSEATDIFSGEGWSRPRLTRPGLGASRDQWVTIHESSMVRVDVYFVLAFPGDGGEWRYVDGDNVMASRSQRQDGMWVASDDHALPLVAFIRSTSQGPPIDPAFAKECADRYAGADNVELGALVEAALGLSREPLPKVLQARFSWFEDSQTPTVSRRRQTLTVGLIGPDGTGKTTICDLVERELDGWVVRTYLGQKEYVLPGVEWIERQGSSVFAKLFRYLAYPSDLFVRRRRMSSRAQGGILLVDRLPMFPFTGGSGRLMPSIYQRALPRFDLLVRLGGDDRTIYDRKPEGDFATFLKNAQKARDMDIARLADVCVDLDATRPLNEVLDSFLASLFATAAFRTGFLNSMSPK